MDAIIQPGTIVDPWGEVVAVGCLQGERYYWFVIDNLVSMMPDFIVKDQIDANKEAGE